MIDDTYQVFDALFCLCVINYFIGSAHDIIAFVQNEDSMQG